MLRLVSDENFNGDIVRGIPTAGTSPAARFPFYGELFTPYSRSGFPPAFRTASTSSRVGGRSVATLLR